MPDLAYVDYERKYAITKARVYTHFPSVNMSQIETNITVCTRMNIHRYRAQFFQLVYEVVLYQTVLIGASCW